MKKDSQQDRTETMDSGNSATERELEALFQHAAPRRSPPGDMAREVRTKLHGEWQKTVRKARIRNWGMSVGIAASLVLAMALLLRIGGPGAAVEAPLTVATIVKHSGQILVQSNGLAAEHGNSGSLNDLEAGHELRTSKDALLSMRWDSGASIRMAENTHVVLRSAKSLELLAGMIYVDTGARPGVRNENGELAVLVDGRVIRHIGTQYMASISQALIEVSVREGRVKVSQQDQEFTASLGEQVRVGPMGQLERYRVATHGELWAWTEEAAPPIELDGKTVLEFLQHVARESGRELAFSNAAVEDIARTSTLSGEVDLPPMRALDLVLETTDLEANTENGKILILAK